MDTKFIILTGGTISGLGKGITLSAIAQLFSDDFKTSIIKLDGYLNLDAGTMNPIEHGEVFILKDGCECDMDFGHYERFLGKSFLKKNSITMGKVYNDIRIKERRGDFLGQNVQIFPHVTEHIISKINKRAKKENVEILFIEVGGTIGDLENDIFIRSLKQMSRKLGEENFIFMHLTYVPIPIGVKEQKTKPTQQSIEILNKYGILPKIILARCKEFLNPSVKDKISLMCNVDKKDIFTCIDLNCVYNLPTLLKEQNIVDRILKHLNLKKTPKFRKEKLWQKLLLKKRHINLKVLIAGKYIKLNDSYASIVEAIFHSEVNLEVKTEIIMFDVEEFNLEKLKEADAIIVPGGFGKRGILGKIKVIKYARENKVPYLGICYGLQLAIIEFLQNVCNLKKATTQEISPNSKYLAITLLNEQKKQVKKGGTMRLGEYESKLKKSTIKELYVKLKRERNSSVFERHRHRFEVNPEFIKVFEKEKLKVVGYSKERKLVEFIELDKNIHPYFVATQSHPEITSKLENPAPLFYGLIEAGIEYKKRKISKQVKLN